MSRLTPAQRHFARVSAEMASAAAGDGHNATVGGSAYELMLYKLASDRRRLKQIQSIERKIELKRTLLPEYQEWVAGALAGGRGAQDDVLSTVLVWHIDVGDYMPALDIAGYAMAHKLTLPDQYSRDIPTMLIDEFSGAYLNGKLAENPQHAIVVLKRVDALTRDSDVPDQARAKLHKAIGYALIGFIDLVDDKELAPGLMAYAEEANQQLHRALALFEGVGVKKDIERLERRLKKAAQE